MKYLAKYKHWLLINMSILIAVMGIIATVSHAANCANNASTCSDCGECPEDCPKAHTHSYDKNHTCTVYGCCGETTSCEITSSSTCQDECQYCGDKGANHANTTTSTEVEEGNSTYSFVICQESDPDWGACPGYDEYWRWVDTVNEVETCNECSAWRILSSTPRPGFNSRMHTCNAN